MSQPSISISALFIDSLPRLDYELREAESLGAAPHDRTGWDGLMYIVLADKVEDAGLEQAAQYLRKVGEEKLKLEKARDDSFKKQWVKLTGCKHKYPDGQRIHTSHKPRCWLCDKIRCLSAHFVCKKCHEARSALDEMAKLVNDTLKDTGRLKFTNTAVNLQRVPWLRVVDPLTEQEVMDSLGA